MKKISTKSGHRSDKGTLRSASALKRLSWEQYIEHERFAPEKSEFFDGELFAMAGGSANHRLVATNFCGEARNALKPRECRVHGSDMLVMCPTGLGTYPDASIVCGRPEHLDDGRETLLNPIVIIEVLSKTTEGYDRGKKFEHYQSIRSLKEYVLISQDHVRIDHFARQSQSGQWLLTSYNDPGGMLALPAAEIELSIAEIYAKVTFEDSDSDDCPPVAMACRRSARTGHDGTVRFSCRHDAARRNCDRGDHL